MSERIWIFDTTLRDGEQSPGASMNIQEKVQMALQLERLGVDLIEAGFAIASDQEFESVREVARNVKRATVVSLTRAVAGDIDRAWNAVKEAAHPRIHVFIATSDIHMKHKLRMTPQEVLQRAVDMVKHTRQYTDSIEFSAEDAFRSDHDFLCKIVESVIEAGAQVVNIPDTVGYAMPAEVHSLFTYLRERVPNIDRCILSCHCHNDLGLAVANSLAAVQAGARQVECTINGIGERAGNAALEEVVMILKTRRDLLQFETGIVTEEIYKTSKLLNTLTGLVVANSKPIVGRNAFAHESGVHQHGVISNKSTYEIMTPESVGRARSELVLGKHSGRHGLKKRCEELGFRMDDTRLEETYKRFLKLTERKKEIFDEDLLAILEEEVEQELTAETFELEHFQVTSGTNTLPTATVKLKKSDGAKVDSAVGDGPVDAIYQAIDRITKTKGTLLDYSIHSVTRGKDALGEVFVKAQFGSQIVVGHASSTDILEASTKAYLNALNKTLGRKK